MEKMRLQKFIAHSGYASRRKAEDLIKQGFVSVNGQIVSEMGILVSNEDSIKVKGKLLKKEENKIYILLNKPTGYITSVSDDFERKTVLDLIKGVSERLYPVGRLDFNTSGLLMLTNDGDFTNFLTHPSHNINKTYKVDFLGHMDEEKGNTLRDGIKIDNYKTAPAIIKYVSRNKMLVTIHEGRNRQVRKMMEAVECKVKALHRVSIGPIKDDYLPEGEWRFLSKKEIQSLGYDI